MPRPRRRGALALLLALPLAGCRPGAPPAPGGPGAPLRASIVLAVGVNNDDRIDGALLEDLNRQIDQLTGSFRTLHPGVRIEVQPFEEDRLATELERRSRDGLAPDLLLVNGTTALGLARRGLIRTVALPPALTDQLNPGALGRARRPDGRLTGVPVLLNPQLACYDRRRLPEPPASLDALLSRGGTRVRVGLPIDAVNLAWTFRPLGVLGTVQSLSRGEAATAMDRARLRAWLEWLGEAHLRHGIRFAADQNDLRQELASGRLDWIPCRSTHLRRLQRQLGPHLGVSVLPAGPGGEASPITRERLLAFGINSTANQRRAAEALARFTISPQVQRMLSVRDLQTLPSNRNLPAAGAETPLLRTLTRAREQGTAIDATVGRLLSVDSALGERFRQLLIRFLFGETDARSAAEELVRGLAGGTER